nr:MAG TPA: hypothetical protein [Caudoviricetes sp.]
MTKLQAIILKTVHSTKKEQTFVFTEDNYKTPIAVKEPTEDDSSTFKLYKISDVPILINQINNTVCKAHTFVEIDGEIQYADNLPWWLNDGNAYQGSNDNYIEFYASDANGNTPDNINNAVICSGGNILIIYESRNALDIIGIDVLMTKGIYVALSDIQEDYLYTVYDEITTAEIKKIDDVFLPEMGLDEKEVKSIATDVCNNLIKTSVTDVLGRKT